MVSPGRRSGLVTMVERPSQSLQVRKTEYLKSIPALRVAFRGLRGLPKGLRRAMTLDNGKELTKHGRMIEQLGLDVYFAQSFAI
ncbi:MAG: hypothetical protein IT427_20590 [Pirellulales bacterium]|nr:hypothetical protein [Pirellulales bacterium]